MKKIILLFILVSSLNAQTILKKGEKAPYDGKLIKIEQYNKLIERSMQADIYEKELDPNMKSQIESLSQVIVTKDQIIETYKVKYGLAEQRLHDLEKDNKRLRFVNNVLIVSNNIGWTITLGYTGGLIAFAIVRQL